MPTTIRAGQATARIQELHPSLSWGWQGLSLSPHSVLLPIYGSIVLIKSFTLIPHRSGSVLSMQCPQGLPTCSITPPCFSRVDCYFTVGSVLSLICCWTLRSCLLSSFVNKLAMKVNRTARIPGAASALNSLEDTLESESSRSYNKYTG